MKILRSIVTLFIASAIIWAVVILLSAYILRGTEFKQEIMLVLIAGTLIHFFVLILFGNEEKRNFNSRGLQGRK